MGADPTIEPLAIHVDADGTIWVDVGNRLVQVDDPGALERILDRLATDRASLRVMRSGGAADDEDETSGGWLAGASPPPLVSEDRIAVEDADAAAEAIAFVLGLARERGLDTTVEDDSRR
jgi:hypothetical protein